MNNKPFKITMHAGLIVFKNSPEPKVKVMIPMYEPLEVTKCKKCGKIIAQPKELIRIVKN